MNFSQEFLIILNEILSDPIQMDKAVRARESIQLDIKDSKKKFKNSIASSNYVLLSDIEAYDAFTPEGNLKSDILSPYEVSVLLDKRLFAGAKKWFIDPSCSDREKIILEAAISSAQNRLFNRYYPDIVNRYDLNKISEEDFYERTAEIQQAPLKALEGQGHLLRLDSPLSYQLTARAREFLAGGMFKFEQTNVYISPGPSHEHERRDMSLFLRHLKSNHISQVFALGRVTPYHPQDGIDSNRPIFYERLMKEDFTNYFIPDASGEVNLPPELAEYKIKSNVIRQAGRITTYQITINDANPVDIHHCPIRDKQPLELTDNELAYIKAIQNKTPFDQHILTHCRGGKGRSAQMAYLLASKYPPYNDLNHEERLKLMRRQKYDHEDSRRFVETKQQENWLFSQKKLQEAGDYIPERNSLFRQMMMVLLHEEIKEAAKKLAEDDVFRETSVVSIKHLEEGFGSERAVAYSRILELYNKLLASNKDSDLFEEICQEAVISETFKNIYHASEPFSQAILKHLQNETEPDKISCIFDLTAKKGLDFHDISIKLAQHILSSNLFIDRGHVALKEQYLSSLTLAYLNNISVGGNKDILHGLLHELEKKLNKLESSLLALVEKKSPNERLLVQYKNLLVQYQTIRDKYAEPGRNSDLTVIDNLLKKLAQITSAPDFYQLHIENSYLCTPTQELIIKRLNTEKFTGDTEQYKRKLFGIVEGEFYKRYDYSHYGKAVDEINQQFKDIFDKGQLSAPEVLAAVKNVVFNILAGMAPKKVNVDEPESTVMTYPQRLADSDNYNVAKKEQLAVKQMVKAVRSSQQRSLDAELELKKASMNAPSKLSVLPERPKLIIFDVDDTLVDLEKGVIRQEKALVEAMKYADKNQIKIAICSDRTAELNVNPLSNGGYTLEKICEELQKKSGVNIQLRFYRTESIQVGQNQFYDSANESLVAAKNYQLDEIRLHCHARYPDVEEIKESDCLFIDDSQTNCDYAKVRNYRTVHAATSDVKGAYLVNMMYQMGAYNGLIKKLLDPALFLNTDGIPDFKEFGFKHTPLIHHVPLSVFYKNIKSLTNDETRQQLYIEQFTQEILNKFVDLAEDKQQDAVVAIYQDIVGKIKLLQDKIKKNHEMAKNHIIGKEDWQKIQLNVDQLIAFEKLYASKTGATYLDFDLANLRRVVNESLNGKQFGDVDPFVLKDADPFVLKDADPFVLEDADPFVLEDADPLVLEDADQLVLKDADQLVLKDADQLVLKDADPLVLDDATKFTMYTIIANQSLKKLSNEHHVKLEDIDGFLEGAQKFKRNMFKALDIKLKKHASAISDGLIRCNLSSSIKVEPVKSITQLVDSFKSYFLEEANSFDISEYHSEELKKHYAWSQAKKLIDEVKRLLPYQALAEKYKRPENNVEYATELYILKEKVEQTIKAIEQTSEYQAMLFLTEAEHYLKNKNWQTGYQFTPCIVDGKRVPQTVKRQLDVIAMAKNKGNYIQAKEDFLRIGQTKQQSLTGFGSFFSTSCKASKIYFNKYGRHEQETDKEFEDKIKKIFKK